MLQMILGWHGHCCSIMCLSEHIPLVLASFLLQAARSQRPRTTC